MQSDGIVETNHGRVRGIEQDGVWRFVGIRYAAPPVGELRFRPPEPPAAWDGVLDATEWGPNAPQPEPTLGSAVPGDPERTDEDCLFLNVWTPALGAGERRPVMVFVHGGAFVSGAGSSQLYRGEQLAARGVVVVTINYRLGVLGFAGHPDLAGEGGCANWGLQDQVAALRWVQENVGRFGGDPGNVTVFGESAGAISVCCLLGAPAARGLFRRAITQSGPAVAISLRAASGIAELLMSELGRPGESPAALRSVPVADLLAAQAAVGARFEGGAGLAFQPVVDGVLLPRHPADAIAAGESAGVDLVVGTNRDEFRFFAVVTPALAMLDEDGLLARVRRGLGAAGLDGRVDAAAAIEAYRAALGRREVTAGPFDLLSAMATDWLFRVPAMRLAEAHARNGGRVWCYLFEWESPFAGGVLGACHALELPFVFGSLADPAVGLYSGDGPEAQELSAAMQASWVTFASAGDPAVGALSPWPAYTPSSRSTMVLGPACRVVDAPMEEERLFWEPLLGAYGRGGPVEGDPGRATLETAAGT